VNWPRFSGFHATPNDALVRDGELWISYERSFFSVPDKNGMVESYPSSLHALIVVGDAKELAPVLKAAERVMKKKQAAADRSSEAPSPTGEKAAF
jgi:hypothetical protein